MRSPSVLIHRHGDASVLERVEVPVAPPGPGEVLVRQRAIGLNFADVYQRRGAHGPHDAAPFPLTLGAQGAGVIEAVGSGVDGLHAGQAVACFQPGAYQVLRNVRAERVLVLPDGVDVDVAGATLLRGLTAQYLLQQLRPLQAGEAVLVHAAAGGMGQLLSQWARSLGATVIGTVGSAAKAEVARANGCQHVIDYRCEDFVTRTLELTGGEGVAVVYDAVGRDVFVPSLRCLRTRGLAINYGTASGDVEAFDLQLLHARSLSVCRPTLRSFIARPQDLQHAARSFFHAVQTGQVKPVVGVRFPLDAVQDAHRALETRATVGACVLIA